MLFTDTKRTIITLIGAVVLFYVFVGRKLLEKPVDGGKNVWEGISDPQIIEDAISKLRETFGTPFPAFAVPADILGILERDPLSEYALNLFLQETAKHCGYSRAQIVLRLFPARDKTPPGRISKLGSTFLMEIHMDVGNDIYGVLAVIVHEFCHFFLDSSGIELVNTRENEVLTDAAAVYFGFGRIMREGYRPKFTVRDGKNTWSRIGYLDVRGIDYVSEKIKE